MNFLRERWRQGFVHRYFAGLEAIDQATLLILLTLSAATVFSCGAIVSRSLSP